MEKTIDRIAEEIAGKHCLSTSNSPQDTLQWCF